MSLNRESMHSQPGSGQQADAGIMIGDEREAVVAWDVSQSYKVEPFHQGKERISR